MDDDFQLYRLKHNGNDTDVVEVPVSWELDDAPNFLFNFGPTYLAGLSSPSNVFEIWAAEFDGAYAREGVTSKHNGHYSEDEFCKELFRMLTSACPEMR